MGKLQTVIAALVLTGLTACHPAESRRAVAKRETAAPTARVAGNTEAATPSATSADDTGAATPAADPKPEPAPAPPAPAQVERLLVPGDIEASVVRSTDRSAPVTVFMPGVCSNGRAYLYTFPEAARKHGGAIAIEGDQPCGVNGFRTFSWDAGRQHARVEAALAAAGLTEIPREGITLVGYSQGAALAEQMVQRWPGRYARVVLIGAPNDPSPRNLARARAVVTMSCDRDVPARMKQAAQAASRAGVPAIYFEMPGCTHGNVTEGERLFDATFDWLHTNEREPDPRAAAVRIAGSPSS
jgi:pimeloyl-ACP methyl ester carboxylesterase